MVNAFGPFNCSEAHAVEVEFKAFLAEGVTVASGGFIAVNELARAVDTDVILFTSFDSILADMS